MVIGITWAVIIAVIGCISGYAYFKKNPERHYAIMDSSKTDVLAYYLVFMIPMLWTIYTVIGEILFATGSGITVGIALVIVFNKYYMDRDNNGGYLYLINPIIFGYIDFMYRRWVPPYDPFTTLLLCFALFIITGLIGAWYDIGVQSTGQEENNDGSR
jgi:tryptophan-rich sensory protein